MTQQALSRIRYGADPELFLAKRTVRDKKATSSTLRYDLKPVPIFGLVGGTKEEPLPLNAKFPGFEGTKIPNNTFIQEDGTALEFNVAPAPDTERLLLDCHHITRAISTFAERKGLEIWQNHTAPFDQEAKDKAPQAFVVGCSPDFSAYTGMVRTCPDGVQNSLTRHAGGHFHIGFDKDLLPSDVVVKFMDLVLGLPSVFIDKQGLRREYYGQAGSFRDKPYGVEYRTLSNFWVPGVAKVDHSILTHFFRSAETVMEGIIKDMPSFERLYQLINWEHVQTAINTENEEMANQILALAYRTHAVYMRGAIEACTYFKGAVGIKKASK